MRYPEPLSVLRGHSTRGIGEGPGQPIRSGEQYLGAEGGLDRDQAFLDAVRPWLSFDAPTTAHQQVGAALEGWAVFDAWGRRWVARLTSAGQYVSTDQRSSYFTHARGFEIPERFSAISADPGMLVGRTEAFSSPPGADGAWVVPPLPEAELADVEKVDRGLAERLLPYLIYARSLRRPVVVFVEDYREFRVGSPLYATLAFVRAALPAGLQRGCNLRTLTQNPGGLLRTTGDARGPGPASLLVVHQRDYDQALRAARDERTPAFVLDRSGERVAGEDAPRAAGAYASLLLDEVEKVPARARGLTELSLRLARKWPASLAAEWWTSRSILELFFSTPALLAVGAARVGRSEGDGFVDALLRQCAMKARLPWSELLEPGGLSPLTSVELGDLVRAVPRAEPAGAPLRDELVAEVRRRGVHLDDWLPAWLEGQDSIGAIGVALSLVSDGLVSDGAVAVHTSAIPLEQIQDGELAWRVLKLEARVKGNLAHRAPEFADLARVASKVEQAATALLAEEDKRWADAWATAVDDATLLRVLGADGGQRFPSLAPRIRRAAMGGGRLVDLVRLLNTTDDPVERVELAARINAQKPGAAKGLSMADFRGAPRTQLDWAVERACSGTDPGFGPEVLFEPQGGLRDAHVWIAGGARIVVEWLAQSEKVPRVKFQALIELAEQSVEEADDALVDLFDQRVAGAPVESVDGLIANSWWGWWAPRTRASPETRYKAGREWVRRAEGGDWAGVHLWKGVLDGARTGALLQQGWPYKLEPKRERMLELAGCCTDAGAVAWLAEAALSAGPDVAELVAACPVEGVTVQVVQLLMKRGSSEVGPLTEAETRALSAVARAEESSAPHVTHAQKIEERRVAREVVTMAPEELEPLLAGGWALKPEVLRSIITLVERTPAVFDDRLRRIDRALATGPGFPRGAAGVPRAGVAWWLRTRAPWLSRLVDRPDPEFVCKEVVPYDGTSFEDKVASFLIGAGDYVQQQTLSTVPAELNKRLKEQGSKVLESVAERVADRLARCTPACASRARAHALMLVSKRGGALSDARFWYTIRTQHAVVLPMAALIASLSYTGTAPDVMGALRAAARSVGQTASLVNADWWEAAFRTLARGGEGWDGQASVTLAVARIYQSEDTPTVISAFFEGYHRSRGLS